MWKQFQTYDGHPFLSLTGNLAFQLNIEWFNPFKHTQHSEGAIYLSILNLPRTERYLQENIILVGVIPGPKEPPLHLNTFLEPLVNDLKNLWTGVLMKSEHDNTHSPCPSSFALCHMRHSCSKKSLRVYGTCSSTKGCSKCLLSFPTNAFGEKGDYSNYEKTQWTERTIEDHKLMRTRNVPHLKIERSLRKITIMRYTILLELPYFDPIQMCVIDPMHNLLLGTCKHIVEIWRTRSLLSSKDFDAIQEKVDAFVCVCMSC